MAHADKQSGSQFGFSLATERPARNFIIPASPAHGRHTHVPTSCKYVCIEWYVLYYTNHACTVSRPRATCACLSRSLGVFDRYVQRRVLFFLSIYFLLLSYFRFLSFIQSTFPSFDFSTFWTPDQAREHRSFLMRRVVWLPMPVSDGRCAPAFSCPHRPPETPRFEASWVGLRVVLPMPWLVLTSWMGPSSPHPQSLRLQSRDTLESCSTNRSRPASWGFVVPCRSPTNSECRENRDARPSLQPDLCPLITDFPFSSFPDASPHPAVSGVRVWDSSAGPKIGFRSRCRAIPFHIAS